MINAKARPPAAAEVLRVLIADDAAETRRSMQLILSLAPNVEIVAAACNGREAVELALAQRPDIAFVDVNMPEMDGLEAIRQMRARRPEQVNIIVSAEKDAVTLRQAVEAGVAAYLLKPFTAEHVLGILEKARKAVLANRAKIAAATATATATAAQPSRRELLEHTAVEFARARRTDDAAVRVFETLAAAPDCPPRWFTHLAIVYALRGDWGKLKQLAAYLERKKEQVIRNE